MNSVIFMIVWGVFTFVLPLLFRKRGVAEAQSMATGFGILGTFVGVVFSLYHFDTGNIVEAVPALLEGLKFAFITSIVGLTSSLLFGFFPKFFGSVSQNEEIGDKTEIEVMAEILGEIKNLNRNIAGDGETTLVTQIQKMRTSVTDKLDDLKTAFTEFAEEMAENNIEQLIKAINQVMEDFNAAINDQLGQSFQELSNSVDSLVEWQGNYKETVVLATEALQKAEKSLTDSSKNISDVSDNLKEIAVSNENISEINTELKEVISGLNQILKSTVDFSKNIKSLSDSLIGSGDTIKKEVGIIMRESVQNLEKHTNDISNNIKSLSDATVKELRGINRETLGEFGSHLASISGKLAEDFRQVQEALSLRKRN